MPSSVAWLTPWTRFSGGSTNGCSVTPQQAAGRVSDESAIGTLTNLESYFVRRIVIGRATAGLNRTLLHVVGATTGAPDVEAALRNYLSEGASICHPTCSTTCAGTSPPTPAASRTPWGPTAPEASTLRIEMPDRRQKYAQEFREGAVQIVEETGKPIAQVAHDLGVNEGTLGNWVNKARADREATAR
ncbi:MAG: transposase [Propionicimonas sp.]